MTSIYKLLSETSGSPGETSKVLTQTYYRFFYNGVKDKLSIKKLIKHRISTFRSIESLADKFDKKTFKSLLKLIKNNLPMGILTICYYENKFGETDFFKLETPDLIYDIIATIHNSNCPSDCKESIVLKRKKFYSMAKIIDDINPKQDYISNNENIEKLDNLLYQFAFAKELPRYLFDEIKGKEAFLYLKKRSINNFPFLHECFHNFLKFNAKTNVNRLEENKFSYQEVIYTVNDYSYEEDFENFINAIEFNIENIEKSGQLSKVKMILVIVKNAIPEHYYVLVYDTLFNNYVLRSVNKNSVSFAVITFNEYDTNEVTDFLLKKHFNTTK